MIRFKKISRVKIAIFAVILIAMIFGVYSLLWFRYMSTAFDPFLKNERLAQVTEQEHVKVDTGWTRNTYRDYEGSGYSYTIATPAYLEFGGNISVLTRADVGMADGKMIYLSEYVIDLTIFPSKWRYVLNLSDLTAVDGPGEPERMIGMGVDRDGVPLPRPANDPDAELFAEWMVLYEKYNAPIMKLFRDIKDVFGEDAFRE